MPAHPITDLLGNLMWTRNGSIWATWRISPLAYNKKLKDRQAIRDLHRALVRCLDGEALIFSSILGQDGLDVVASMMDGYDMAQLPLWVEECHASMERFAALQMGQRYFWLSVPLANRGVERVATPVGAAWRRLQDAAGYPLRDQVSPQAGRRLAQAGALAETIPAVFEPRPVSPAEQAWYAAHCQRRGMLDVEVPTAGSVGEELFRTAGSVIPEALLDEGARTSAGARRGDVMGQRVLKVLDVAGADVHDAPASFQCLMALAQPPAGGLTFPGSELFMHLDTTGIDVDWAMRLRINGHSSVIAKNRAAMRAINEQFDQRDREASSGLHDLEIAVQLLAQYDAEIAADQQEVEVEHATFLAVAAACPQGQDWSEMQVRDFVMGQAKALAKHLYEVSGCKWERLPGSQEAIWWAMQPGVPAGQVVTDYRQYTTSTRWAALVPFINYRLGGERGPVLMLTEGTARPRAVHMDLSGYPELDKSGSALAVGEMGSGKSYFLKTCAYHVAATGGRWMAVDKTAEGEWATFAQAFAAHTIIDPTCPAWSMDPLRILGVPGGVEPAAAFVVELLNLNTQGELAQVLDEVLTPQYLIEHHLEGLGQVTEHLLGGGCALPQAQELGARLAFWARKPSAQVMFDPGLPPADLQVPAVVWRTHSMDQPTTSELHNEHLFRSLAVRKVFGRAYYRLVTSLARKLAFADPTMPVALIADELYDFVRNPANVRDLVDFLRQGRRPKALLFAGTHDIHDLDDDTLADLIPTRVLCRPGGEDIATRALKWIGYGQSDPDWPDKVKDVLENLAPVQDDRTGVPAHRRGECYVRDAHGAMDRARIIGPASARFAEAVRTTPGKAAARS